MSKGSYLVKRSFSRNENPRRQADQIPPLQVLLDSELSFGGIGRLILVVRINERGEALA